MLSFKCFSLKNIFLTGKSKVFSAVGSAFWKDLQEKIFLKMNPVLRADLIG